MGSDRLFFGSYATLYRDVKAMVPRLPEADAIVGVPRSGMLPAAMLATLLHKPLGWWNPHAHPPALECAVGTRLGPIEQTGPIKRALVIDDACYAASFRGRFSGLRDVGVEPVSACVYGGPGTPGLVDVCGRVAPRPRVFSWNLLNCSTAKSFCVDLDGVLCEDPTEAQNDDGPRYLEFIANAPPLHRCAWPVHSIVTSRLEKYRGETEAWLEGRGIKYGHLVMAPYLSKAERKAANRHAEDKAEYFAGTKCHAFIESSERQAKRIAELTGRPVICTDTDTGYNVRS